MQTYDVAITGMGAVSCLGIGTTEVEKSLRAGNSGITIDEERRSLGFRSPLTGQIKNFNNKNYLDRKRRKTMDDLTVQAYAASDEAIACAGLKADDFCNFQSGIIFGNDSCSRPNVEAADALRKYGETYQLGSGYIFRNMTSTVSMNLSTIFGIKGANWTLAGACASGNHAIGQAWQLLRTGEQERMLIGGAQEISWEVMAAFDALGAFSVQTDAPDTACRPFDKNRDGLVPSGGAAALVIERMDVARARGANILAEIKSYAFSSDGEHLSQPSGVGARYCMAEAIKRSGLSPSEITYVNAHATSTPVGDKIEAGAILDTFGENKPYVSSTKSMTGHECWMSGASELVYSLIMMQGDFLAPNINFSEGDEVSSRLNLVKETANVKTDAMLLNSFGFGGTNATIVIQRSVS
jgi:3-oxoacyl-[acyl-carrier-protein] synthase-1